jgi:hypothetical protein
MSPIILTRTPYILEMLEMFGNCHSSFSCNNLRDDLVGIVAVSTNPKVLHDLNRCSMGRVNKPKHKQQLLTTVIKSSFCSSSASCKRNLMLGIYPAAFICQDKVFDFE